MSRLRAITERDRLAEAANKLEAGEKPDWGLIARLQQFEPAIAGRAALNDALDREEQADADLARILGD